MFFSKVYAHFSNLITLSILCIVYRNLMTVKTVTSNSITCHNGVIRVENLSMDLTVL